MKIVKIILYVVIAIVALFFIVAALLPSTGQLERSTVVNAPVDTVFNLIVDYNNYIRWNPWSEMEPDAEGHISGPVAAVGQSWSWDGKIIGSGSLTTEKIIPNEYIESKLEFIKPNYMVGKDIWKFEAQGEQTRVTWINESELDYPVGRYFGLFLEGMLGKTFEKGLSNVKNLAEE